MNLLDQIDEQVRKTSFVPRALEEETGISTKPALRTNEESDGYWNVRMLTFKVTGMHYRTPQFNLALLEHYINYHTAIRETNYNAPAYSIRFETNQGTIKVNVRKPVDVRKFRKLVGLK